MRAKEIIRNAAVCVLVPMICFLAVSCRSSKCESENKPLRIGVSSGKPPLVMGVQDDLAGTEISIAQAIAEELNMRAEFIPLAWEDLIDALLENRIDVIISGMTITHDREYLINFSESYLTVHLTALMRQEDLATYETPEDIIDCGGKIGIKPDTTGDIFVRERCMKAQRVIIEEHAQVGELLKNGSIDLYISDDPVCRWLAAKSQGQLRCRLAGITRDDYGVGVRKNDPLLLEKINTAIARMKETGVIESIMNTWTN